MKLNVWKNIVIGLKGLLASLVGGLITYGFRLIGIKVGININLMMLVGIIFGFYVFGFLVSRWCKWN